MRESLASRVENRNNGAGGRRLRQAPADDIFELDAEYSEMPSNFI
jgi:hypothetical protein